MKRSYILCLLLSITLNPVFAQLTGISPNQGALGQLMQTTITSNGLFIQSSTPSGNIYEIKLKQGANTINIYQYWSWFGTTILDADSVISDWTIPLGSVPGLYDLEVITGDTLDPMWNQNTYTLPGAFTIQPPDGFITGNVYNDLNKNGVKDVGEPGIMNRTVKINPGNYLLITDVNGDYSFPALNGNYSVILMNNTTDYTFVTGLNDTLQVVINNANSPGNDFGVKRALISISPGIGQIGVADTHLIVSDEPIFAVGGQPWGNVQSLYILSTPNFPLTTNAITVIDSYTIQAVISPPVNTVVMDSIDLRVSVSGAFGGNHYLFDQFTIDPPDGYVTGTLYHDINSNGILDTGEPGLANRYIRIIPPGMNMVTNANGIYSIAVANGNYSVTPLNSATDYMFITSAPDTIPVTVNNNTASGNDFGLRRTLQSITPTVGYPGLTTVHQIVADDPIFTTGGNPWGNVTSCRVYSNPQIIIGSANVVVIDNYTIQVTIAVPLATTIATNIDVSVSVSGTYGGTHRIVQGFAVQPPPATVSGTLFLDQNQNKLLDTGEPGIGGGKVLLSPDSSIGFSNNSGAFIVGSLGGPQTLTYENNIAGLLLFTDSVSYTFNSVGAITGKDFGFISSLPDYSIHISEPYLWPRCNSIQPVIYSVKNTSNYSYDASVWIKYDPQMTYNSSIPAPVSVANDTVHYLISNIQPYSEVLIKTFFMLPGGGSFVQVVVNATSLDSNSVPQLTDFDSNEFNIICAMDPNDKQVTPPGIFTENFTLMGDTLDYLIRFQNTGNDTAFNVVVLDTLDNHLDFTTFEILDNSHSMQTELETNGALRFTFNNIMLPDSNVNEPESHGYIRYRIRALPGLSDSTEVINTAYIYFDFNSAVITNTTLNTLVFVLPTAIAEVVEEKGAVLYPNPAHESAVLYFKNPASDTHILRIVSATGSLAAPERNSDGTMMVIDTKKLSKGVYFYTLTNTRTKRQYAGKMVVE